jgi:hypothetical protein
MTHSLWTLIGVAIVALLTLGIGGWRLYRFPAERRGTLTFIAIGMLICSFLLLQDLHALSGH